MRRTQKNTQNAKETCYGIKLEVRDERAVRGGRDVKHILKSENSLKRGKAKDPVWVG